MIEPAERKPPRIGCDPHQQALRERDQAARSPSVEDLDADFN
jgi:hypothetical protein